MALFWWIPDARANISVVLLVSPSWSQDYSSSSRSMSAFKAVGTGESISPALSIPSRKAKVFSENPQYNFTYRTLSREADMNI